MTTVDRRKRGPLSEEQKELAARNVCLAERVASMDRLRDPDRSLSAAMLGLVEAARAFEDRGIAFRSYASTRVLRAVQDSIDELYVIHTPHQTWKPSHPSFSRGQASRSMKLRTVNPPGFDEPIIDGWHEPECRWSSAERVDVAMDVRDAIDRLTPRSRTVVMMLMAGHTHAEIAEELGLCESRISTLHREIFGVLRTWLQDYAEAV